MQQDTDSTTGASGLPSDDPPQVESRADLPVWKPYLFAIGSVLLILSAFFYKTVFLGKPIAKLGLLANIDAILSPGLKEAVIAIGKDPSGYLIFFPNGHFADSMWSRFVFPIWNPLIACGFPLLGDPQSFIHSPAHLLRIFSGPQAYNAGLIIEIAAGGIGMVLFARALSLSPLASVFASLAFVLSPRVMNQVDIGGNECLFPWVAAAFAWLAQKPTLPRAALCGVACAMLAFAAHPETCFFAVLFTGILSFFLILLKDANSLKRLGANLFLAIKVMALAAIVSLLIAAPLVMPFLEYMKQAYVYKDALNELPIVRWQEFWDGFLACQGAEAFFIGSIAVMLIPLAFLQKSRLPYALLIAILFGLTICLPEGAILQLFSQKPLSYVVTLYGIPDVLLLFSVLAAVGFDELLKDRSKFAIAFLCAGIFLSVGYPIWFLSDSQNISSIDQLWKSGRVLLTHTSVLAGIAGLISLLVIALPTRKVSAKTVRIVLALALIALNFASLALPSRNCLPNCPPYSLTAPPAAKFLADSNERVLATGNNFLLTNASMNYGIRDIRAFSPLLPRRYVDFISACGARCYNLYFYNFPDRCSHLLDLASIKYVATRAAIGSDDDSSTQALPALSGLIGHVIPGIRMSDTAVLLDPANKQVSVRALWTVHEKCNYRYALQQCTLDADGKELWSSREAMLGPADLPQHKLEKIDYYPIPQDAKYPISIAFRVKDTWTSSYAKTAAGSDLFVIAKFEKPASLPATGGSKSRAHFVLSREFQDGSCRVYENTRAFPQAYLVQSAMHLGKGDSEKALALLKDPSINFRRTVVLEDGLPSDQAGTAALTGTSSELIAATVERPDCNTVICTVNGPAAYLVLTDANYPGWTCKIDGKDTVIHNANLLFRAVKVEAGPHKVVFEFRPPSYFVSLAVAVITFVLVILLAFFKRKEL